MYPFRPYNQFCKRKLLKNKVQVQLYQRDGKLVDRVKGSEVCFEREVMVSIILKRQSMEQPTLAGDSAEKKMQLFH